jgi:hypothetical protein
MPAPLAVRAHRTVGETARPSAGAEPPGAGGATVADAPPQISDRVHRRENEYFTGSPEKKNS